MMNRPPYGRQTFDSVFRTASGYGILCSRPWRQPLRVFISHTRELRDLPAERSFIAAVEAAILRAGMTVTDMEYFAARDFAPASVCAEQVAAADLVVGVLGMRYGSLVPDRPVSYTELEFDVATKLGKPRLMFLLDDSAQVPLPASALIDRENGTKQDAFRAKVLNSGLVTGSFSTPAQLEMLAYQALVGRHSAPARSRYLTQVRDIAPGGLAKGREPELAELAAWCQGDEPYVWWQAPPWAGKSALMSTFVLQPPPGVQVLSFFVTGRLAAQADAVAFTDAVLEQLAVLTGEGVPESLGPGQREVYRRDLLQTSAAQAAARGERLVLVVDGLDEDVGGQPGTGLPSIASLLPRQVPDGLRIIVAGRPHPELPEDVAGDHPLRDCPRRMLDRSPYAVEAARAARLELDGLLAGDPRHRDLIGLVTAAGGGLTSSELQELTRLGRYEIEAILAGVCGRTVEGRTDTSLPEARRVHLFAHETLRTTAVERLDGLLDGFRRRVHDWVDGYRGAGWPENTPAYALNGYFPMLSDVGDLARMAALATDDARHGRMLAVTGGDGAALAEIRAVERVMINAADPDLVTMARLNVHRTVLADKNSLLPVGLPAVWARMGNVARSEALARSLDVPRRAVALGLIAQVVALTGDRERAKALMSEAELTARTIQDLERRTKVLVRLVANAATTGDYVTTEMLATGLRPLERSAALAAASSVAARHGDLRAFRGLAERTRGDDRRTTLLTVLTAAALIGDHELLDRRFAELEAVVDKRGQIEQWMVPQVAKILATVGGYAVAKAIASDVIPERTAVALPAYPRELKIRAVGIASRAQDMSLMAGILGEVALALVRLGDHVGAAELTIPIRDLLTSFWTHDQLTCLHTLLTVCAALNDQAALEELSGVSPLPRDFEELGPLPSKVADVVVLLAEAGRIDLAERMVDEYSDLLDTATIPADARASVQHRLAGAAARGGHPERAASLARGIEDPARRAQTLTVLATTAAAAGQPERATALAAEAEALARTTVDATQRSVMLTVLAAACAAAGNAERARQIAVRLGSPELLGLVSRALAVHGKYDEAEQVALLIDDMNTRVHALCLVADALRAAGLENRARGVVERTDSFARTAGLSNDARADLSTSWARAGMFEWAEWWAKGIDVHEALSRAFGAMVGSAAQAGETERLPDLIRRFPRLGDQAAVAALLTELAGSGHLDEAESLVGARHTTDYELVGYSALAVAAAPVAPGRATRLAARAEHKLAEALARNVRIAAAVPALTADRDGDFDRAEDLVGQVSETAREDAWFLLAGAAIRAGRPERAEAIARDQVAFGPSRLNDLIVSTAESGDFERAERMARELADPSQLAGALAAVAGGLAKNSPDGPRQRRARRHLAEALSLGTWTDCVDAIAMIEPGVVLEIDRQLSRELGE